jgi:hypothetical protein
MKNNFESSTPILAKYAQPIIYKKCERHKDPHLNRLIKPYLWLKYNLVEYERGNAFTSTL